jgi:class 3 adenylate cyclase/tetratricopeptide (TPR) repeat protein
MAAISARDANLVDLLRTYHAESYASLWQSDPSLYETFAKRLIARGHPTRAFELAREGLAVHRGNAQLRFFSALALARGGNVSKAADEIDQLLASADLSPALRVEAQSLAGRLLKDRYQRAHSTAAKRKFAKQSAVSYTQAYRQSHEWFPGINAATMSLLAGDVARAKRIAREIVARTGAAASGDDLWLNATLGEAHVILGDLARAGVYYRAAVAAAAGRIGDIASIRRNVLLLGERMNVSAIQELFSVGSVIVFSGHMIDHPQRARTLPPRFPQSHDLEANVAGVIRDELQRINAAVGFSSAASGSDILFAEAMLARPAELHIVLPFALDDFYLTSVDFGLSQMREWRARCDAVLERATQVHLATEENYLGDDVLFDFANNIMQGLAITRARELGASPSALVVAERAAHRQVGGAAHFLHQWRSAGREVREIDLAELRVRTTPVRVRSRSRRATAGSRRTRPAGREIHAMLFADVKNFSKLREEQAPSFFVAFLDTVAGVIASSKKRPVFANTWGDGLFLVFKRAVDCADLALRLLDRINAIDWRKHGLPPDTTVRMGLHAGPVYPRLDKIIKRVNFFGSHVNRAARIEPVTTPGCAFTSDQFAALLAVEPNHPFICEYVGIEQLAKEYARCPLYRLSRS